MSNTKINYLQIQDQDGDVIEEGPVSLGYDIPQTVRTVNVINGIYIDGADIDDVFDKPGHTEYMINKLQKQGGSTSYYMEADKGYFPTIISSFKQIPTLSFKSSHFSGIKDYGLPTVVNDSSTPYSGVCMLKSGRKLTFQYAYCDSDYDNIVVYFMDGTNTGKVALNGSGTLTYENVAFFRFMEGSEGITGFWFSTVAESSNNNARPMLACCRPSIAWDSQERPAYDQFCTIDSTFHSTDVGTGSIGTHVVPVTWSNIKTITCVKFILLQDTGVYYEGIAS